MANKWRRISPSSRFDVRTNMLALLVVNTLVMTGKGGIFQLACVSVVAGLLLCQHRRGAALALVLSIGALILLPAISRSIGMSRGGMMVLAAMMYVRPWLIAGFMGYYFICATPPNLLIAGMNRLRAPRAVTIPLSVILRFFPVIWEEQRAIRGAMRMRGLPGSGGMVLHPWQTLEYLLIPLIGTTLRSGEALSISALSRGLGSSAKPSSILPLKFGPADLLLLLLCIALAALFFFSGGH